MRWTWPEPGGPLGRPDPVPCRIGRTCNDKERAVEATPTRAEFLRRPGLRPRRRPHSTPAAFSPRTTPAQPDTKPTRSEEHTSELQSLMRISYAVFCLKKTKHKKKPAPTTKKPTTTTQTQ